MFNLFKINLTIITLFLSGCASYNPGKYADVMKGEHPLNTPINAEITYQLSSDPYKYVNFTFGNKNEEDWTRVKSVRITSIGGVKDARLLVGPDLLHWSEGINRKVSIDAHNSQMFWGALAGAMAIGAGVSGAKGNKSLTVGLAGGALLSASVLDINNLIDKIDSLEISQLVPSTHLYTPFSIPPKLFLSRWVVIQMPKGKALEFLDFEVTYLSGKKAQYKVKLENQSRS